MIREILKTPEQFQTLRIGDLICGIEKTTERPIISPNDEPTFIGIIKDLNAHDPEGSFMWSLSDNPERFKATMRNIIRSYESNPYPNDPYCKVYCEVVTYCLLDTARDNAGIPYALGNTTELCLYYEEDFKPNWIPFRIIDNA